MATQQHTRRLCSEIQLFDLCDLEDCGQKDGRYCHNPEALERFEAIKEEDERAPEQYLTEEPEEEEGDEDLVYDDSEAYEVDEYDDDEP